MLSLGGYRAAVDDDCASCAVMAAANARATPGKIIGTGLIIIAAGVYLTAVDDDRAARFSRFSADARAVCRRGKVFSVLRARVQGARALCLLPDGQAVALVYRDA